MIALDGFIRCVDLRGAVVQRIERETSMKLLRIGAPEAEIPAVLGENGTVHDLRSLTADIDASFLASGGIGQVRQALADGALPPLVSVGQRIGAPVVRPGKVVCVGLNYRDHAEETGAAVPERPVVFMKDPATVVGPYDQVLIPRGSVKTDWEVELAVVIGREARYLASPDEAAEHIAGYAVSHDVSEREYQLELSPSGTSASLARRSTRWAPGWSQPTRSATLKHWDCASQ